ncbi:hypothetical protein V474_07705 [Novosphingobium barchaimii LL02]|uniref:Uncharacterized protein n=1 Tax=Novosphingobium barchaimii LL02 TaxID=1114963 RepID=A0A0J7Y7Q9_9SPHN|nr:hypothetical protein [Novosphingobium barchaimii]KMS59974.1 hypothetical protein V474_07705 [Novosphingobium barchaimii LL02]
MADDPVPQRIEIPKRAKQRRFEQFERMGEARVRELILIGRYTGQTLEWAREWLSRFDNASREERMEASNRESSQTARSAKNAAWAAAIAAVMAVIVPIVMPFIFRYFGIKP